MKDQSKNKAGSKISKTSFEIMKERQEEKKRINKFNRSEEGKKMHKTIKDLHSKEPINPDTLPF